ncbi:acyl-CoA dehydrogenase family protein [Halocatena salina]|uniref:Acyl-CoA dehydrogenase family protein n=1 Tax=Halocatena salina TaxID=2934340 RepID=A0A8U0A5F7_9EURY|nr:acyl-CoA dehydrogenase family protein [Halocatena salina]UPM44106.1 acyl-CoA dehydrogenase family protein [Halocatena salina]
MELLDDSVVPEHAQPVKQQAREFATEEIEPVAEEYFRSGEYPWEVLEAGMDAGLVAQDIGEEYGGRGFDLQQLLAIAEELYRADAGIGLTLMLASFGAEILEGHGTEQQKEEFLRPVAENSQITGLAVSEPESGSDLAGMRTTATKEGDEYVLDGEKYWIGNGVEADWVTLYAKTGDDEQNRYGNYSLFIVPTDTAGYEAEHIPEKMAMRASKQAHITLDGCRIPVENRIGPEGSGFYILAEFFNHGRIAVGGHGLGLAAAAIEEAWAFVHDREAFGRDISDFQSVQHTLAEMRTEFEAARALNWRAARKVENQEQSGFWAAMAKTKSTETATMCAEQGMQLHGGRSILTDRRIARVYRDVRVPVIYEGANEVQRNLIYSQSPR